MTQGPKQETGELQSVGVATHLLFYKDQGTVVGRLHPMVGVGKKSYYRRPGCGRVCILTTTSPHGCTTVPVPWSPPSYDRKYVTVFSPLSQAHTYEHGRRHPVVPRTRVLSSTPLLSRRIRVHGCFTKYPFRTRVPFHVLPFPYPTPSQFLPTFNYQRVVTPHQTTFRCYQSVPDDPHQKVASSILLPRVLRGTNPLVPTLRSPPLF